MRLFDKIFGRQTKTKNEDKSLSSFWEDEYCQIEIVPRKNIEHIKSSVKQIEKFTEGTRTEYGFTGIFAREVLLFPTLNEELRIDYFENILSAKGFEKAKQIRYEGNTIIDCSIVTSNAFSLPCFTFFMIVKMSLSKIFGFLPPIIVQQTISIKY